MNVQEWGCFSIYLRADDVTRTMSKGGVLVNVQEWGCFSIFRRADDVTRTMSKGLGNVFTPTPPPSGNPVSAPGPPPPFKNPGSAPDPHTYIHTRVQVAKIRYIPIKYICCFVVASVSGYARL